MEQTFTLTDDSGFLAIVNAQAYASFYQEDWTFDGLLHHFRPAINKGHLTLWRTCNYGGGMWKVAIAETPSARKASREFAIEMLVTSDRLYLTNYEDLTMAAAYEQYSLPLHHNRELYFDCPNGIVEIRVRQLFDPDDYDEYEQAVHFEIVLQKSEETTIDNDGGPIW